MPINSTTSPLGKKYGKGRVAQARNIVKARMGRKLSSFSKDADLP